MEQLTGRQRDELKAAVVQQLRPSVQGLSMIPFISMLIAQRRWRHDCLDLPGRAKVIDAACASSLIGLSHAITAIEHGHMDAAIVAVRLTTILITSSCFLSVAGLQ